MSTMQSEVYDAFIEAGASEPKARAAAEVIAVSPKTDISELKADIEMLRTETKTDISKLKADISELKADISELKAELYRTIWLQGAAIIGINIAIAAFLASLIK